MLLQSEAVAAVEWQLSCSSPSKEGSCSAKALLRHLVVNPAGVTTDLPLLQPLPLTLTLQVKEVRIHLLAETADAPLEGDHVSTVTQAQALGIVYATSCQVCDSARHILESMCAVWTWTRLVSLRHSKRNATAYAHSWDAVLADAVLNRPAEQSVLHLVKLESEVYLSLSV